MPMGKGTYGTTKGRPPAKKTALTGSQKKLPMSLKKKIMAKNKRLLQMQQDEINENQNY